jgi:hypothetical protein
MPHDTRLAQRAVVVSSLDVFLSIPTVNSANFFYSHSGSGGSEVVARPRDNPGQLFG